MKKPNIVRNLQCLGSILTRVIQDDPSVKALRKFNTNLLQVKVHFFGVRFVAKMVDTAAESGQMELNK